MSMIRPIAFCAGLALAWCGTAEARQCQSELPNVEAVVRCIQETAPLNSWAISKPDDAVKIEIEDLRDRVEWLERLINTMLPECIGDPPEHLPCIEREAK